MKLDDKHKVIEVLLCCSHEESPDITNSAADDAGLGDLETKLAADAAWLDAWRSLRGANPTVLHHIVSAEAAYRLIESSPMLRREWFGAR